MQNFPGRILTNTKTFDHITPLLHELGWLTIEWLLCLRDITMNRIPWDLQGTPPPKNDKIYSFLHN